MNPFGIIEVVSLFSDNGKAWVGPSINLFLPDKPMVYLHAEETLLTNEWNHLACVYDGRAIAMYINGKNARLQVFVEDADGVRGSMDLSELQPVQLDVPAINRRLSIGGNFPGSQEKYRYPYSGSIRDLRISRVVRYTAAFRPEPELQLDADTVSLYRFDATTKASVADQANRFATALAEKQFSP